MTEERHEAYDRVQTVSAILSQDDTLLGRVYRYDLEGLTPAEIAIEEGNSGPGFVSNHRAQIRALRDGDIPSSPSIALQTARRVRKWLKSPRLEPRLRADLESLESLLMSRAEDATAQYVEEASAVEATEQAEASSAPGTYVYTLPHYLRYPYEPESGKTMLKVGHSSRDAHYRATSQGRLTALPEDPILLRIYPTDDNSGGAEREFHAWLTDADHGRSLSLRGGWRMVRHLDQVPRPHRSPEGARGAGCQRVRSRRVIVPTEPLAAGETG